MSGPGARRAVVGTKLGIERAFHALHDEARDERLAGVGVDGFLHQVLPRRSVRVELPRRSGSKPHGQRRVHRLERGYSTAPRSTGPRGRTARSDPRRCGGADAPVEADDVRALRRARHLPRHVCATCTLMKRVEATPHRLAHAPTRTPCRGAPACRCGAGRAAHRCLVRDEDAGAGERRVVRARVRAPIIVQAGPGSSRKANGRVSLLSPRVCESWMFAVSPHSPPLPGHEDGAALGASPNRRE